MLASNQEKVKKNSTVSTPQCFVMQIAFPAKIGLPSDLSQRKFCSCQ